MSDAQNYLKMAVKGAFKSWPIWAVARRFRRPGAIVLLYHRVGRAGDRLPNLDVANFAKQMQWLREACDVIHPADLADRAAGGRDASGPSVVVTFDDGYKDYFENAYPVLKSLGISAVNFPSTAFLDDPFRVAWWDRLYLAAQVTRLNEAAPPGGAERMALTAEGRRNFVRRCKDYIKQRPAMEHDELTSSICRTLGVDEAEIAVPRQTMTWDEVRAASDFTVYGGHTHTHVIVSQVDEATLDREIGVCRDRLQSEIGVAPNLFAYPNGRSTDFNNAAKLALTRHGFNIAFSAIEGIADTSTDWMEVPRIPGGTSVADLAWRMSRVWHETPEDSA
jgi:peptidoglycan/xylan/chitin deacetylase (PgdA/CDA1 family)